MTQSTLSVTVLTHSTTPRGGVMHTVYLAEAFQAFVHRVCVLALAKAGAVFCRPIQCEYRLIPALQR